MAADGDGRAAEEGPVEKEGYGGQHLKYHADKILRRLYGHHRCIPADVCEGQEDMRRSCKDRYFGRRWHWIHGGEYRMLRVEYSRVSDHVVFERYIPYHRQCRIQIEKTAPGRRVEADGTF